jgi:hypothetical protein
MATLFAATMYLGARVVKEGLSLPLAMLSAAVVSIALLTKAQGIVAAVLLVACIATSSLGHREEWTAAALSLAVAGIVGALWYGVRIASGLPVSPTDPAPAKADPQRVSVFMYGYRYVLPIVSRSFWGKFGWLAVRLPDAWYLALESFSVAGLAASAVVVARAILRRAGDTARWVLGVTGVVATAMLLGVMVLASLKTFRHTGEPRGLQGRYLFPVLGVIAVAIVGGWLSALPARARRFVAPAIIAFMTAVSLAGLWSVVKWFYGGPGTPVGTLAGRLARYSGIPAAPGVVAALAGVVVVCAATLAVKSFHAGEESDPLVRIST